MNDKYDILEWAICGLYFAGWIFCVVCIICD